MGMWLTLAGTSARCTSTSHTGGNAWRTKGSGKPGGCKSVFLVRIDSYQHRDNLKTCGSCRKTQQMRG